MAATPFSLSAPVYDLLYEASGKDYAAEAAALHDLIQRWRPGAASLLDVACGTGAHLAHLRRWYDVAGVDVEPAMIGQAQGRLPEADLRVGDMRSLSLGRRFDAVICLFSSIGYMRSPDELALAVAAMAGHLAPGGVLVVDGWLRPAAWRDPGLVHALAAGGGDLAAARVGVSRRDGRRTHPAMHHLVGTPDGVEHVVEHHELTLFDDAEYREAFRRADVAVEVVDSPLVDRDRYVATRAQ